MEDINMQTFVKSRLLLGWLSEQDGALSLAGRDPSKILQEHIDKVQQCNHNVSSRKKLSKIENPLSNPPAILDNFISQFWNQPDAVAFKNENWEVAMADLSKVCTVQPNVYLEHAKERLQKIDLKDILQLASISLPSPKQVGLPVNYDSTKNAWIVSSPNPNLRVNVNINAPTGQGLILGFLIGLSNSFIQVAECNGRFILRDGYHRAIGLLSEGITNVPVLTKKYNTYTEMNMPAGLLPQEIVFGDNPPFLTDFLNDDVSVLADSPLTQKTIIIQALELSIIG
jgi:hypothetical protein